MRTLAVGALGAALGVAAGTWGCFLSESGLPVLSTGALVTLVVVAGGGCAATRLWNRAVGLTVVAGWMLVTLPLISNRPEGDVVVLSDVRGLVVLACGFVIAPVVVALTIPRR